MLIAVLITFAAVFFESSALAAPSSVSAERAAVAGADAPTSGPVRIAFTTFLRSREGILATIAFFAAMGTATLAVGFNAIRSTERTAAASRPSSRRARRRYGSGAAPGSPGEGMASRSLAALLAAAAFLLPLVFTIALADVFAEPKTIVLWGAAIVSAALMALGLLSGAGPRRFWILEISLIAFVALTVLATILSIDPNQSLKGERLQYQGLLSILAYVVLFVAARWSISTAQRARVLAASLLASAGLAGLYAIAQWFRLDPIWDALFKDRVFSAVGQANALASILGMAGVAAVGLVAGIGRRRGVLLLSGVAVVAIALVLTFSRGGYLAVPIGIAVAGVVLAAGGVPAAVRALMPRLAIGLGAAALVVAALVVTSPPAREFVGRVVGRVTSIPNVAETSNRSHLDLWEVGIRIAAEHPILGTGPDTYVLLFPQYRDEVLTPDRAAIMAKFRPESAHNVYISTAAGSGIPSLIAYLVVIAASLLAVFRAARREIPTTTRLALAGLAGAAVIHLVTDGFMTGEPSSAAVFWIFLGGAVGLAERHLPTAR
jgi:O-antigen ligase